MLEKKKNLLFLLIFLNIIFFPILVSAKSQIGDTCEQWATNDDCEKGGANFDCQESTLPQIAGKPQYFCTCYNDSTCTDQYGGAADGGEWKCNSGNSNSNGLSFCKSTKGLVKKVAVATPPPKTCKINKDCPALQYCLNNTCYAESELTAGGMCKSDSDCVNGSNKGVCVITNADEVGNLTQYCFYTSVTESITCGSGQCTKSEKACTNGNDCSGFGGAGVCKDGFCWLDEISMKKYKEGPSLFGVQSELQIKKPVLEINIPQLKFSDIENTVDDQGYIHLPYIGEYMSAIYKVAMVAISIIGVIMIIVVGTKITVLGGEERVNGFKKIGQIVIGLLIAWGSYTILYNINPDLVQFKTLKVQYIDKQDLTFDFDSNDNATSSNPNAPVEVMSGVKKCDPNSPDFVNFGTMCGSNKCPGIKNVDRSGEENYLRKDTAEALKNAGKIAEQQGYYISVRSKCRSLATQQRLAAESPDAVKSGTVAKPGGSPHGFGGAVDLVLYTKSGQPVSDSVMSAKLMCKAPAEGVATLSKIMYKANFVRLGTENWHFEFPQMKPFCRKKTVTGVAACVTGGAKAPCLPGE